MWWINTLLLQSGGYRTWGDLLGNVATNPQRYLFWIIIFLVLLFLLSRFNNFLEVRGVDRAIYITRGLVGTIMYFVIAPIVIYILLLIMALIYGIKPPDITFLGQWLGQTLSSYWWLLRCFFNSSDLFGQQEIYNIHSFVHIVWILGPATLIWLRMTTSRVGKLMILPFIIGVLVVTRYKKAPVTFLTKDDAIVQNMHKIPLIGRFFEDETAPRKPGESNDGLRPSHRKFIAGTLVVIMLVGFVVGLYIQQRVLGLVIVLVGFLGFLLLAPGSGSTKNSPNHHDEHPVNVDIANLVAQLDSLYVLQGESIEVYELAMRIEEAYNNQSDKVLFPDSLCVKYNLYFYNRCSK